MRDEHTATRGVSFSRGQGRTGMGDGRTGTGAAQMAMGAVDIWRGGSGGAAYAV